MSEQFDPRNMYLGSGQNIFSNPKQNSRPSYREGSAQRYFRKPKKKMSLSFRIAAALAGAAVGLVALNAIDKVVMSHIDNKKWSVPVVPNANFVPVPPAASTPVS